MVIVFQVPLKSLRCVSALISAMGKMPVLTPPTPMTSCGHCLLLSHWSLAVSLVSVYAGNLSKKKVDRALVAAGYSMGPFQAMRKVRTDNHTTVEPSLIRDQSSFRLVKVSDQ